MKLNIIAYSLCALFLAANVVVYYYQRHRFIEIITAWKKEDKTIAHKAWLYDLEHEALRKPETKETEMELIQQAMWGYSYPPQTADSNCYILYFRP